MYTSHLFSAEVGSNITFHKLSNYQKGRDRSGNEWTFHYLIPSREGNKVVRWDQFLKPLEDFATMEEFYGILKSIEEPEKIPQGCRYYVFKKGIQPLWEDIYNIGGHQIMIDFLMKKNDKPHNDRNAKKIADIWINLAIHTLIQDSKVFFDANGIEFNNRGKALKISLWYSKNKEEGELKDAQEYLNKLLDGFPNATLKMEEIKPEEPKEKAEEKKAK